MIDVIIQVSTIVLTVLLGLCVGSFLNVVIYRLPNDMSLAKPASHCLHHPSREVPALQRAHLVPLPFRGTAQYGVMVPLLDALHQFHPSRQSDELAALHYFLRHLLHAYLYFLLRL